MNERTKALERAKISQDFSAYYLFRRLDLYTGPQDIRTLSSEFIEEKIKRREEEARKEGAIELAKAIRSRIEERIDRYISLITRIVDYIYEAVQEEFADEDLRILEARTNFDFDTQPVGIMFIIDAAPTAESDFLTFVNGIEKVVLHEDGYVANLLYVNNRDAKIDEESILYDYPFVRDIEKDK